MAQKVTWLSLLVAIVLGIGERAPANAEKSGRESVLVTTGHGVQHFILI